MSLGKQLRAPVALLFMALLFGARTADAHRVLLDVEAMRENATAREVVEHDLEAGSGEGFDRHVQGDLALTQASCRSLKAQFERNTGSVAKEIQRMSDETGGNLDKAPIRDVASTIQTWRGVGQILQQAADKKCRWAENAEYDKKPFQAMALNGAKFPCIKKAQDLAGAYKHASKAEQENGIAIVMATLFSTNENCAVRVHQDSLTYKDPVFGDGCADWSEYSCTDGLTEAQAKELQFNCPNACDIDRSESPAQVYHIRTPTPQKQVTGYRYYYYMDQASLNLQQQLASRGVSLAELEQGDGTALAGLGGFILAVIALFFMVFACFIAGFFIWSLIKILFCYITSFMGALSEKISGYRSFADAWDRKSMYCTDPFREQNSRSYRTGAGPSIDEAGMMASVWACLGAAFAF